MPRIVGIVLTLYALCAQACGYQCENGSEDSSLRGQFERAFQEWVRFHKENHLLRGHYSQYPFPVQNGKYARIVGMGPAVLPFMVEKLADFKTPNRHMVRDVIVMAGINMGKDEIDRINVKEGMLSVVKRVVAVWEREGKQLLRKALQQEAEHRKKAEQLLQGRDSTLERFDALYSAWLQHSRRDIDERISKSSFPVASPYYKAIVSLGPECLPYMIKKISSYKSPDWFMVFDFIQMSQMSLSEQEIANILKGKSLRGLCRHVVTVWEKEGDQLLRNAVAKYEAGQPERQKEDQTAIGEHRPKHGESPPAVEEPPQASPDGVSNPQKTAHRPATKKQQKPASAGTGWLTPLLVVSGALVIAGAIILLFRRRRRGAA